MVLGEDIEGKGNFLISNTVDASRVWYQLIPADMENINILFLIGVHLSQVVSGSCP